MSTTIECELKVEAKKYKTYYDELGLIYKEYSENLKSAGLSELSSEYAREIKREKAISFMGPLNGKSVLDLGCGQGTLISEMAGEFKVGIGVDISRNIFPKTKQGIELVQADICFLPFVDAYFDIIITMELIEHLEPHRAKRMLEEIRRLLKQDGTLILTTPRPRSGFITPLIAPFFTAVDFVYCLLNPRAKEYWLSFLKRYKATSQRYGLREHVRVYKQRELASLVTEVGFVVYTWSGSTISPYLSPPFGIFLRANEFAPRFFRFWKKLSDILTRHFPERSYWDNMIVCGMVRKP